MSDEAAFLRSILDNPQDAAPWLIYAEHLDERGRPAGPFVRAHLADLQKLAADLPNAWTSWIEQIVAPGRDWLTGQPIAWAPGAMVAGSADLERAPWPSRGGRAR
jgi:uncharacterized protein (TIGR02996 family)